jgi:hypothetical protein
MAIRIYPLRPPTCRQHGGFGCPGFGNCLGRLPVMSLLSEPIDEPAPVTPCTQVQVGEAVAAAVDNVTLRRCASIVLPHTRGSHKGSRSRYIHECCSLSSLAASLLRARNRYQMRRGVMSSHAQARTSSGGFTERMYLMLRRVRRCFGCKAVRGRAALDTVTSLKWALSTGSSIRVIRRG